MKYPFQFMKQLLAHFLSVFILVFMQGCSATDTLSASTEFNCIKGTKTAFNELHDGDQIVITVPSYSRAISFLTTSKRLASVPVIPNEDTLTIYSENVLVFTYQQCENNTFRLCSDYGYLTSSDDGKQLYCSSDPGANTLWTAPDHDHLQNMRTADEGLYLQYVKAGRAFVNNGSAEDTTTSSSLLAIYRIDDSSSLKNETIRGYRLPVFETTDVHGSIIGASDDIYQYRLAYIADIINNRRLFQGEVRNDMTVLLDGGDIFQGNAISNLLEGNPLSHAYAVMNYDAVTIGNHEFDWNLDSVIDHDATMMDYTDKDGTHENHIPVVMMNLFQNGEKTDFTKDYVILDKTAVDDEGNELPVRIGVIGFSTVYKATVASTLFEDPGFSIVEDYDALSALAKDLKTKENCNAVILLSHSDTDALMNTITGDMNIDLVLCGHMHMNDTGRNADQIPFLMCEGNAQSFGQADLVFDKTGNGKAILKNVTNIKTIDIMEHSDDLQHDSPVLDDAVLAVSDHALKQAEAVFEEEIGYITESSIRHEYFPESNLHSSTGGNWYTSIVRRIGNADVAFFNRFGMRSDIVIAPGETRRSISASDIYDMFPFSSHIYCYKLTCKEFLAVLEYSLTEEGSTLLSVMSGIDCYFTDRTVNAIVRNGQTIYANGKWVDDHGDDTILVAVNEFVAITNRTAETMDNPLYLWKDSDKMINNTEIDNLGALQVLRKEASENNGHLSIDTECHFKNTEYTETE